mmetsp:Transcript_11309/g.34014  ORF Transcript_11309/g.34014 Transcript_11309/m.34014 type:complete len:87 (+) Transcript_11309:2071-2331(+)
MQWHSGVFCRGYHWLSGGTLLFLLLYVKLFSERGLAGVYWSYSSGLRAAILPHHATARATPLGRMLPRAHAEPPQGGYIGYRKLRR